MTETYNRVQLNWALWWTLSIFEPLNDGGHLRPPAGFLKVVDRVLRRYRRDAADFLQDGFLRRGKEPEKYFPKGRLDYNCFDALCLAIALSLVHVGMTERDAVEAALKARRNIYFAYASIERAHHFIAVHRRAIPDLDRPGYFGDILVDHYPSLEFMTTVVEKDIRPIESVCVDISKLQARLRRFLPVAPTTKKIGHQNE